MLQGGYYYSYIFPISPHCQPRTQAEGQVLPINDFQSSKHSVLEGLLHFADEEN